MSNELEIRQIVDTGLVHPAAAFAVNVSTNPAAPYWQRIDAISLGCDDGTADDYDCDGDCLAVLHIEPAYAGDPEVWHMTTEHAETVEFRRVA